MELFENDITKSYQMSYHCLFGWMKIVSFSFFASDKLICVKSATKD